MNEKRAALIISYYFPPYVGIEGQRPASWYEAFHNYHISTDIVTRVWSENEVIQNWEDYIKEVGEYPVLERSKKGTIHYLPHRHRKFYAATKNIPGLNSFVYWGYKLIGHFHIETDGYNSFKQYIENLIKEKKFDFILVTSPPLNLIRLGYELAKKNSIPLVIDYRDSFDNMLLNKSMKVSFTRTIENFFFKNYLKKWNKKVLLNTIVSPALLNVLPFIKNNSEVVLNGFEEKIFRKLRDTITTSDKFIVHVLGNLYKFQGIDAMLTGYKLFLNEIQEKEKVKFDFIGLGTNTEVAAEIRKRLPEKNIFITNRMKREEALKHLANAVVCFNTPGSTGYKGVFGGKTFDYIGAGKFMLVCPSDNDILQYTIRKFELGKTVDTAEEIRDVLVQQFNKWKNGEFFSNDFEKVKVFSREHQSQVLINAIEKRLKQSSQ